jgi:hypothetical protein
VAYLVDNLMAVSGRGVARPGLVIILATTGVGFQGEGGGKDSVLRASKVFHAIKYGK